MEVFTTDRIRNVVLLGHGGAGKTKSGGSNGIFIRHDNPYGKDF